MPKARRNKYYHIVKYYAPAVSFLKCKQLIVEKAYMRTLLLLMAVSISVMSCRPNSSPEKRMDKKNQELSQKVEVIFKQQQILRDSISILKKEIDAIKYK